MKKIIAVLIFAYATLLSMYAQNENTENKKWNYGIYVENAFSYYLEEQTLDILTGNSLVAPGAIDNLINKKNVVSMNTFRTIVTKVNGSAYSAGTTLKKNYTFENGLVTSIYNSASDVEPLSKITYDNFNRLESYGETSFEYQKMNNTSIKKREISYPYWNSNQKQQVRTLENGFEVITDTEFGIYTSQYIYEKDLLMEQIKYEGIDKKVSRRVSFTYEDKLPIKIKLTYFQNNKISYEEESTLMYENSNMTRVDYVRFRSWGKEYETRLFSNHDEFGNWQDMELLRNDVLIESFHRDIVYAK